MPVKKFFRRGVRRRPQLSTVKLYSPPIRHVELSASKIVGGGGPPEWSEAMQHIEKVVLRIAVTGTPEGIRECVRNFALDLPNDISRVEFAPLEGVEQFGEQDRADFAPPRPPRRKRPRAAGVQTQTRVRHRHQSRAP